MADQKLVDLTGDTTPDLTDVMYASDAAGTVDKKVAIGDLPFQPVDSDLTAIAALSTTAFGRALLVLADSAAGRTALGLGTAATHATGDYDLAGAAAAAQAASQPLDSDLTAIAALTTTSYGRAFLALADAAAGRTALGLGTAALSATGDFDAAGTAAAAQAASQPVDSDLTAIAALTTTSFGRSVLTQANAAALRTLAGTVIGTDVQAFDAELAALAGLTSAADKLPYFTGSGTAAVASFTAAGRALIDDADAAAQLVTLGAAVAPVRDTAANLAAANAVYAASLLVIATDTGVLAYGDGATAYNSLVKYQPRNAAMVQSTTSLTTQSAVGTAGADWSGLTITLTADGISAIRLHAHCGEITDSLTGGKARMIIQEGASVITRQDSGEARANGSAVGGIDFWCPSFIPTSGSHTYKVVVASILSTSTATFTAGSADPALLESVLA